MKSSLFLTFYFCCALSVIAQQKERGNSTSLVGRMISPTQSVLNVNTAPTDFVDVNVAGRFTPLRISRDGKFYNYGASSGILVTSVADARSTCGLESEILPSSYIHPIRGYAVKGNANGGFLGLRYGLFGSFSGAAGAGVYGTTGDDIGIAFDRRYAGYFNGDTKVAGALSVSGGVQAALLGKIDESASETPADYAAWRLATFKLTSYSGSRTIEATKTHPNAFLPGTPHNSMIANQSNTKTHYGLKVMYMPHVVDNLVYTDENGDQYINYTDLIPLIVSDLNELRGKVEGMNKSKGIKMHTFDTSTELERIGDVLTIGQNSPNPFSQQTTIPLNVPQDVQQATLYVYDLNGKQLKSYVISERGHISFELSAKEFEAGIYLYLLIAEGKICGTQRMIITP